MENTDIKNEEKEKEVKVKAKDEVKANDDVKENDEGKEATTEVKAPRPRLTRARNDDDGAPPAKAPKLEQQLPFPIEIIQTIQQLTCPKPTHNGLPARTQVLIIENGKPVLTELQPLQQCQQMQQIQNLIQYHEGQAKYRSYLQLELLRSLRKQLSDQMMTHPTRSHYEALLDDVKHNRLTPLSPAEKAQLEYFTAMAEWTLEARAILQDKETPFYLLHFGRQVNDYKTRLNEITTHEQFQMFAPMLAQRIDYHRELIHTLNRRSSVSIA
ncbi:unnamed protein product [Caenorhabditis sp. 36 PRJEB53466]|nr:unnamed protein product [Caenorhabditis sp. 36 PRJEB53466]